MKNFKINQIVFCVNKASLKHNLPIRIFPAKIIGAEVSGKNVIPIVKQGRTEVSLEHNFVFESLEKAVNKAKK